MHHGFIAITLGALLTGCGTLTQFSPETGELTEDGSLVELEGNDEDADGDGVSRAEDCDDQDDEVYPGATDYCDDDLDADCDGDDCLAWNDDFESGDLRPTWNINGVADWRVGTDMPQEGAYSAVSGDLFDGESCHMSLEVDVPAGGVITFWHAGSTEANYDYLLFVVDGVQRGEWSGVWSWQQETSTVPAGSHTFQWTYAKDVSQSAGADRVLVDSVSIEGGTP